MYSFDVQKLAVTYELVVITAQQDAAEYGTKGASRSVIFSMNSLGKTFRPEILRNLFFMNSLGLTCMPEVLQNKPAEPDPD
jgi:hypothetical protein